MAGPSTRDRNWRDLHAHVCGAVLDDVTKARASRAHTDGLVPAMLAQRAVREARNTDGGAAVRVLGQRQLAS